MDFFRFPGEIRNQVYEKLLVYPGTLHMLRDGGMYPLNGQWSGPLPIVVRCLKQLQPAILRVSKKTKAEGIAFLYSRNLFSLRGSFDEPVVSNEVMLARFARQIGSHNAGLVRHIMISFPGPFEHYSFLQRIERSNSVDLLISEYGNVETAKMTLTYIGKGLGLDSPVETTRGLALLDTKLRLMPSLVSIVVRAPPGYITTALREAIVDRGWTTVAIPR